MWRLEKRFRFEASHVLPNHKGKCARLHGHSWNGTLVCEGDRLKEEGSSAGMLVDFSEMWGAAAGLIEGRLDHYHLNDSTGLFNPTSEEVSRWIFQELKPSLPLLVAVVIEETCTSRCEYRPKPVKGDI